MRREVLKEAGVKPYSQSERVSFSTGILIVSVWLIPVMQNFRLSDFDVFDVVEG